MKQLLSTNNMADLAFAQALLQGEGIAVFEMDVNMSVLEGGIGIFPRRLMVVEADYEAAAKALRDNGLEVYERP
ncbi:putative signal transducing protein [Lentibacter sp.]|uniref:putative signal transducing protein n=1 Tax=Lentibacter sp. TaxID=2024994 RepID=UPI003F69A3F8